MSRSTNGPFFRIWREGTIQWHYSKTKWIIICGFTNNTLCCVGCDDVNVTTFWTQGEKDLICLGMTSQSKSSMVARHPLLATASHLTVADCAVTQRGLTATRCWASNRTPSASTRLRGQALRADYSSRDLRASWHRCSTAHVTLAC